MDKVKVVLDWFPNTNHTGFYVAQKKGYFLDVGLDVHIEGKAYGALQAENTDIVLGPQISMLTKTQEGLPVTAIASITQKNDSGIVSLKEANISRPKDLEGKRLTHWKSPWFHAVIREWMKYDGGDYDKVQLIGKDVANIFDTLGSEADAVWVYENWENQELLEAGKEINYIPIADIDPLFDFCAPCVGAQTSVLKEREDVICRFLAALHKGYVDAANDPEQMVLYVKEYMPYANVSVLIRSQKHLANLLLDETGSWGYIEPKRWNMMADWVIEQGLYDKRRKSEFTNACLPSLQRK